MAQLNKLFNGNFKIPTLVFFIATIVVIFYFFPREGKYKYSYTENRPWQYGLLTAPFNFHIHKSDVQIQQEHDSILNSYMPYYESKQDVGKVAAAQFGQDGKAKSIPSDYISYVNRKFTEVYKAGIISAEDYDKVQQLPKKQLQLRSENSNAFSTRHLASFYTPKQAYDKIISDAPAYINTNDLHALNLNDYLNVNVFFDEKKIK